MRKLVIALAAGMLTAACSSNPPLAPAPQPNPFRSLPASATTPTPISDFQTPYNAIEKKYGQAWTNSGERIRSAEQRLQDSLSKPNAKPAN